MAKRMDYARAGERARIARHGSESVSGGDWPLRGAPPRKRPSKAERQAENEAARAAATQTITCPGCGHQAKLVVTRRIVGKRLRCAKCGSTAGRASVGGNHV